MKKSRMILTDTYMYKCLCGTTILAICFGLANSDLVVVPRDAVAVVGQTAFFNCSTSNIQNQKIHWQYNIDTIVYAGGKFLGSYERFRIEIDNTTGSCNLVIPNVTRIDAGRYWCLDNEGFGNMRHAELVVLDENPLCKSDMKADGIVGPNNCNIDPDDIHLSCSTEYSGNIAPILKWTRLGYNSPISTFITVCRNSTNRVDCNLTIKADDLQLDGSTYICHTELTTNINCTSDAINMIYSFNDFDITKKPINAELSCKANSSNTLCMHRWIWNALDGSGRALQDKPTVTANTSGIYRCESECNIRGKQCTVTATIVYVTSDPDNGTAIEGPNMNPVSSEPTDWHWTAVNVLGSILILILSITLLICCIRLRKFKEELKQSKPEGERLSLITSELKNELAHALASLDNGNKENESLRKDLETKSEENLKLHKELTDVRASLDNEKKENESLAKELETSKKKIEELQKQKVELQDKLSHEETTHKKQAEDAEQKRKNLEKEVQRLKERNCELTRSLYKPPTAPIEYKVEPHETIKTLASQGPENVGVCGLAVLDKELYVISDGYPEIEVYEMPTFKYSRSIKLRNVADPGDITACNENKFIYIVDWTKRNLTNTLLRLDTNGKEEIERKSLPDDECRLFVTREFNVLVTFFRRKEIIEYTQDWCEVFRTKIKQADIHPIHSVKLSNGFLAFCYGRAQPQDPEHGVCIIDDNGDFVKSFGGLKGSGFLQVNFPNYIAVDSKDNLLVADRDNGRVLVLNSHLELTVPLLAKKDKLRRPRALLLDDTNSRLIVADCRPDKQFSDGRVLTFNLK